MRGEDFVASVQVNLNFKQEMEMFSWSRCWVYEANSWEQGKATAAYNEAAELVFMTRVEQVADFVQLPTAENTKVKKKNVTGNYHPYPQTIPFATALVVKSHSA